MEMRHILVVLVVLILSGCAAEVQEQPTEPSTPEVTPPVEPEIPPEIPPEEPVEEEPEVVGGAEDIRVLRGGFDPEELTVSAGTVVTWKNMDDRVHIILLVGGERSPSLNEGDIFEYEFGEAGTYQVMDAIFGFRGSIIVE